MGLFMSIAGLLAGFLVALGIGATHGNAPYTVDHDRPLAALNDTVGTRGSFLGFNPSGTYVYYEQTKENTYQMRLVRSAQASVVETDDRPHVVKETSDDNMKRWYFQAGDEDRYTFYIPKGSIIMNYRLDAQ